MKKDVSDYLAQTLSGSTDTEKVLYEDITLTTGLSYSRVYYRQASQDALKFISLASLALQPVNGHYRFILSLYELARSFVSDSLRSMLEAKAFLQDTSTSRAGGFRNQQKDLPQNTRSAAGPFISY